MPGQKDPRGLCHTHLLQGFTPSHVFNILETSWFPSTAFWGGKEGAVPCQEPVLYQARSCWCLHRVPRPRVQGKVSSRKPVSTSVFSICFSIKTQISCLSSLTSAEFLCVVISEAVPRLKQTPHAAVTAALQGKVKGCKLLTEGFSI